MLSAAKYHNCLLRSNSFMMQSLLIFVSSLILAASAQIVIPWQPVPLTFQSAMVVLLGLALGPRRATLAVGLYLLEGAVGLPVYAGFSGGFSILLGAAAGYLFGFLPAAFIAGWLMEEGMVRSFLTTFITALIGAVVIFACGVAHLQTLLGWQNAFTLGVKPFLITEPIKLLVVAWLAMYCWKK